MSEIPEHLKALYRQLLALPASPPPSPWRLAATHAVGGLTDVGFADSSDLLLVISVSRGLFDCVTGERIARDPSEDFDYDTSNLLAFGIGPLAERSIRTAGLHGGGLAFRTWDGWGLDLFTLAWPVGSLFLTPPGHWIYGPAFNMPGTTAKLVTEPEIRAFGFSPTGRSFIIATSSDLSIFNRDT
jgi:hypothetical protein